MLDFTLLTNEEIVAFIGDNADVFGSEMSDRFPASIVEGLAQGHIVIVREQQGFAVAYIGRHHKWGGGHFPADLIFLYVAKHLQGQGIGSDILSRVKEEVTPGVSITLVCEGSARRSFFERNGFQQIDLGINDWFEMEYTPSLTS